MLIISSHPARQSLFRRQAAQEGLLVHARQGGLYAFQERRRSRALLHRCGFRRRRLLLVELTVVPLQVLLGRSPASLTAPCTLSFRRQRPMRTIPTSPTLLTTLLLGTASISSISRSSIASSLWCVSCFFSCSRRFRSLFSFAAATAPATAAAASAHAPHASSTSTQRQHAVPALPSHGIPSAEWVGGVVEERTS